MRVNLKGNEHKTVKRLYTSLIEEGIIERENIIVCVGTDRVTGDCLGPLVGTLLTEKKIPGLTVIGTLEDPVHALNIHETVEHVKEIEGSTTVIAIDACIGDEDDLGNIILRDTPIKPGQGVGKKLPRIGDYSIIGITANENCGGFFSQSQIRLGLVYPMAKKIAAAIEIACNKVRNEIEIEEEILC